MDMFDWLIDVVSVRCVRCVRGVRWMEMDRRIHYRSKIYVHTYVLCIYMYNILYITCCLLYIVHHVIHILICIYICLLLTRYTVNWKNIDGKSIGYLEIFIIL